MSKAHRCDSCGKFAKNFVWVGDCGDEGTECEHCTSESVRKSWFAPDNGGEM